MPEVKFADGLIVKDANDAPDYVKMKLSFKCEEFHKTMKDNSKSGWLNVEVKESKKGKLYAAIDTWEPKQQDNTPPEDSIPF